MRFDIVTIFPEFFAGPLDYGIVRRAREAQLIEARVHDLREFAHDRHRTVDDRPFGGGEGMVMKPEPLFEAVESLVGARDASVEVAAPAAPPTKTAIVLLSAAGKIFRQETARRFAGLSRVVLICGRYEGVDERVAEHLATDEISGTPNLVVDTARGELLIPLAQEICVDVDLATRRIVVVLPEGLRELNLE